MEGGSDPQKGSALRDRWAALKPRVIRPLGRPARVYFVSAPDHLW